MQKLTLRKTVNSLIVVVIILIAGLFLAQLIVSMIDWFVPLTYSQVDMIVYLLYVSWLFGVAYYYAS